MFPVIHKTTKVPRGYKEEAALSWKNIAKQQHKRASVLFNAQHWQINDWQLGIRFIWCLRSVRCVNVRLAAMTEAGGLRSRATHVCTLVECLCIKGKFGRKEQSLSWRPPSNDWRHGNGLLLFRCRLFLFCVEVGAKCSGSGQCKMSISPGSHQNAIFMDCPLLTEDHLLVSPGR